MLKIRISDNRTTSDPEGKRGKPKKRAPVLSVYRKSTKVTEMQKDRTKRIYEVTLLGGAINLFLVVFKFAAGIWGHSAAMVADAIHSLSDFATDLVVMVFVRMSSKPKDKGHDYGHGKYETLATAIIGTALLVIGIGILWSSLKKIFFVLQGGQIDAPGQLAFWAAILSIVLKEAAFQMTRYVGQKVNSQAVIANAWHHRSDALSSIGSALGIGGAILLGDRWHILDPLAAAIVSFFILKVALSLLKNSIDELTERSLPDDVEEEIIQTALQVPDICEIHNLRTRRIGNEYAIEMHIRMDGNIPLYEAHCKASAVERKLKERFGPNTHVGIHTEPIKVNGMYPYECTSCQTSKK